MGGEDFGNLVRAVFENQRKGKNGLEKLAAVTPNATRNNSMEWMRDSQRIHFERVPTLKGYQSRQSKFFMISAFT